MSAGFKEEEPIFDPYYERACILNDLQDTLQTHASLADFAIAGSFMDMTSGADFTTMRVLAGTTEQVVTNPNAETATIKGRLIIAQIVTPAAAVWTRIMSQGGLRFRFNYDLYQEEIDVTALNLNTARADSIVRRRLSQTTFDADASSAALAELRRRPARLGIEMETYAAPFEIFDEA